MLGSLVGGSLALKIGLPTPNLALINLNREIIKFSSDLSQRNIREGVHIGFCRLPVNTGDFYQLTNQSFVTKKLENGQDLCGVICFDNWVLNSDRNNQGNNMIEYVAHNKIRYHMVDFGHCFTGNGWDEGLENRKNDLQLMNVFQFFDQYIKDFDKYEIWFSNIENLRLTDIDNIVNSIPPTWNISIKEKTALSTTINHRKNLIRSIIINNKGELGIL
jgi:hypothetical protein